MEKNPEKWVCAHCGYTESGRFTGDICPQCGLTYWQCDKCAFIFTAGSLPETCPQCGAKCDFKNVTCYIPECGGPSNVDQRLVTPKR